jgi:uncharacterized membrane protein
MPAAIRTRAVRSARLLEPLGTPDHSRRGSSAVRTTERAHVSRSLGRARTVGLVLLGLQLIAMLAFSTVQYRRFALSNDFGTYSQAWWSIAHGHLSPWGSLIRTSFWRDNAEFAMWPLALVYYIVPNPIVLLWIQDILVVLTGFVAFSWALDVIGRSGMSPRSRNILALGVGAAIALNPWAYNTIAYDFHVETVFALFVVLAGRDLWAGRYRRLWLWVTLAVLSDVLGALCIAGVGAAGLVAGRQTRKHGAALVIVGIAWVAFVSSVHGAGVAGRIPDTAYAYLAPGHVGHLTVVSIVAGALRHPAAVLHMVSLRWLTVFEFLVTLGLVGCISPWGFGVAAVVFVPTILSTDHGFLNLLFSFQSWPALPFVLVGSTMLISRWLPRPGLPRRVAQLAACLWAGCLAVIAFIALPAVPKAWIPVDSTAAAALAQALQATPASAEVIASQGLVGRFAQRDHVYPYVWTFGAGQTTRTYPINSHLVVFIISAQEGTFLIPRKEASAAVAYVEKAGAKPALFRGGISVLRWVPPRGTLSITLP